jgi:hypothetical protein
LIRARLTAVNIQFRLINCAYDCSNELHAGTVCCRNTSHDFPLQFQVFVLEYAPLVTRNSLSKLGTGNPAPHSRINRLRQCHCELVSRQTAVSCNRSRQIAGASNACTVCSNKLTNSGKSASRTDKPAGCSVAAEFQYQRRRPFGYDIQRIAQMQRCDGSARALDFTVVAARKTDHRAETS